jgi:hypothetical protein
MRLRFTILLVPAALTALGCSAQTLDAGSNGSSSTPAATTRATFGALIDAVTMDDSSLYLACEDGWIYSLAKDGTSPPAQVAPSAVPGSSFVDGIAVDDSNVYWTAQGSSASGGAVLAVPKAGGMPIMLAEGRVRPWGIAVDDANVYWAEQGLATDPQSDDGETGDAGALEWMPKSGGGKPQALASELGVPDFVAMDGDGVVWHDASTVSRVPVAGGPTTMLFSTPAPSKASNLVVTGGVAYFGLDDGAWSIESVSTSGGAPSTLAGDIAQPAGVAVVGASVFWSLAGGPQVGAIDAVLGQGTAVSDVSAPDVEPGVMDEQAMFFLADDQAFYSVEVWQSSGVTVAVRVLPR